MSAVIRRAFIEERAYSVLRVERDLKLAKLCDEGLYWHGTDANASSSDDYTEPRRVASALYKEFQDLDGVAYKARHDNGELCYALFDRVHEKELATIETTLFKNAQRAVDELMHKYGA